MRLHYKALECKTIQYVERMNLQPYICTYCNIPVDNPVIHVGDSCKDKDSWFFVDGLTK